MGYFFALGHASHNTIVFQFASHSDGVSAAGAARKHVGQYVCQLRVAGGVPQVGQHNTPVSHPNWQQRQWWVMHSRLAVTW
jgi:hypothetical protein